MKKRIIKKIVNAILLIAVIALVGFRLYNTKSQSDEELANLISYEQVVPVKVTPAQIQPVEQIVEETGVFRPSCEIDLVSETRGLVLQMNVKTGDHVSRGDILAVVEKELVEQQVALAEMNLQNARGDLHRFEKLLASDAVTMQQYEQVKLTYQNALSQVAIQKEHLENTCITAPADGYISSRHVEPGTFISPGMPLMKISRQSQLLLETYLSESTLSHIKTGEKVLVIPAAASEKPIDGVVEEIAVKSALSGRYRVTVRISNPSMAIRPGMSGKVQFCYSEEQGGMVLPRKCVISSVLAPSVYVVSGDTVIERTITASLLNESQVVVHKGLHAGEMVVHSGHMNLSPGTQVRIIN